MGSKRFGDNAHVSDGGSKRTKPAEVQPEILFGSRDTVAPGVVKQKLLEPLRGMMEIGPSTENISQVGLSIAN